MSAKWQALQHRNRYTYSSIVFPKLFTEILDSLPRDDSNSSDFFSQLKEIATLGSTYAQISAAKGLASSFARFLAAALESNADVVSAAVRLYLEILFLENSLPLHRTLISALAKSRKFLYLISTCILELCKDYCDLGKKGRKRFSASRAVLSLMGYPKLEFLNKAVEKCANLVAMDVAHGLGSVITDIESGSRLSPSVMEQCQEAMSCLYYLLQRFPNKFFGTEEGSNEIGSVVNIILSVLKSSAFSRDCLVSAGVSFCAAIQACMRPDELSLFISRGFFGFSAEGGNEGDSGVRKVFPNRNLYLEIQDFSVLSRLCLLRGILTAIPRSVLSTSLTASDSTWTILYNGILPELCKYCENPIDSHFNFHALTVTQICLQQIKTSILSDLTNILGNYDPIPQDMTNRILRIIWNNLEDPLSQTIKQVHLIFDLFLNIESSLPSDEGVVKFNSFLCKIAGDLLRLGPCCKGRYVPLASLTKHLCAKSLLHLNPDLLFETAYAYMDDDVCCAATSFLKCFLECLRDECWSHDGIEKGYDSFRGLCLPPLLHGLVSGNSKLRSNLNIYALPVVLEIDPDSIFPMLAYISVGPSNEENKVNLDLDIDQRVAALVSLLKVSRTLALIEGDIDMEEISSIQEKSPDSVAVICVKGINVKVPMEWFVAVLTHADESLRIDAAESLFLNPKMASLPSSLELNLLREAIPLNMRCCSTSFQMKWTSLFRKFFSRVRTALDRLIKQGSWQPTACYNGSEDDSSVKANNALIHKAEDLFKFMRWLSCFLYYSCYPSAPYERKAMAMELILIMIDVWPISPPEGNPYLHPYNEEFTSSDSTLSFVGSMIDSWDRLRESSYHILLSFPTPLPGLASHYSMKEVIEWARKLVCSPRAKESDAGALIFKLIFKRYVLEHDWSLGASLYTVCVNSQSELVNGYHRNPDVRIPIIQYISSLIEWLQVVVEEGEKDLYEACMKSFVHGVLVVLRYTFEELDWRSEIILLSSLQMRCLLKKLFELVMRVTSLALWVVSADVWSMPYDMDDFVDNDDAFPPKVPFEMDKPESLAEPMEKVSNTEENGRPAEHVVMVGCWLAMKEVSLLLGTIIRKVPLPSSMVLDQSSPDRALGNVEEVELVNSHNVIIDFEQLETIGNHFLQVLLKMKHNGAIDKTRAGFTALCNRLLCSNDPRLCKMIESWMEQLMERTIAKGQTVDDLLRRSAGIPAAFMALFLSEPEGTPKKLLPRALRWLVDLANMSLSNTCGTGYHMKESENIVNISNDARLKFLATEVNVTTRASKIRDEGVIPTVHAFNSLRAAFNDANLAVDTSGFCAEALISAIRSFSSPYWEVRNSACLAYTALVRRMIGFLNVQKRESARRALTGLEFFHRYPALHAFLISELKIATELLGDGSSKHTEANFAKAVHPSLCPILILLSRLKPSLISSQTDEALDPLLFMPFIRRCATQNNLRVRSLASRALTGLVSNEKLHSVINDLAYGLPRGKPQIEMQVCLCVDSSSSSNMSDGDVATTTPSASFNSIHGSLLQLSSLIDNNCRNLTDVTKRDQILGDLIVVLLQCTWIGSNKLCPCPTINSLFLQVLDQMLGISRTATNQHVGTIRSLLLKLSSECLDNEQVCTSAFYDPTKTELCRQAVSSYFSCLLGENQEVTERPHLKRSTVENLHVQKLPETGIPVIGFENCIISCIFNSTFEVRLASLKGLLRLLKSLRIGYEDTAIHIWAESNIQFTMMQILAVEENPKCLYYVLKIIFSWNTLQPDHSAELMDIDAVFCFWNRLVQLNGMVTRAKTKEVILLCMGLCMKQFTRFLINSVFVVQSQIKEEIARDSIGTGRLNIWNKIYNCIDSFILLAKQHSSPSEPVNMREAAAESIVASGFLEEADFIAQFVSNNQPPSAEAYACDSEVKSCLLIDITRISNLYACRILDVWFICIQLLEDEDVGLRQKLAKYVQRCINSRGLKRLHCHTDSVPSQVDSVIELSFEFLSSIFGHWLEYLNYLLKCTFDAACYMGASGDLVHQIFDKEIDNHHEEKLLICQICCSHLEKLLVSENWKLQTQSKTHDTSSLETFLQGWRLRFLRQVLSFANSSLKVDGIMSMIGGPGNHKDVFIAIFVNLLGLYALTQCLDDDDCCLSRKLINTQKLYLSEFTELRRTIKPFLRHPLISNLFYLVIQSHEKMCRIQPDAKSREGCSVWNNFDPYFLLR